MADLQQLSGAEPRPASFIYRDQVVNFEYDRSKVTAEWIDQAMLSPGLKPVSDALVQVLISWDVMSGEAPVKIEAKTLYGLPVRFMRSLTKAIADDATATASEEGKASPGTSPLEGSLVESPGGQS